MARSSRLLVTAATAGVLGALAIGGVAYAVTNDGSTDSGYAVVTDESTTTPQDNSTTSDRKDCPEGSQAPSTETPSDSAGTL